jgi:chromosome segregation ATPase
MAQVQLVSKQMSAQHTEVTNRVDEVKTNEISNKLGIKTMKEDIETLTKLMKTNFKGVKQDLKDETKKLFEQNTNTKMSLGSTIADVEEKLNQTSNKLEDEVQNFNDETFALQGSVADLNEELTKLATRSNMWDIIQKKLEHHVKSLGKECTALEEGASSSKPTTLSLALQRYLAGNTQRIAKLIATKADFEVSEISAAIHGKMRGSIIFSHPICCSPFAPPRPATLRSPLLAGDQEDCHFQ